MSDEKNLNFDTETYKSSKTLENISEEIAKNEDKSSQANHVDNEMSNEFSSRTGETDNKFSNITSLQDNDEDKVYKVSQGPILNGISCKEAQLRNGSVIKCDLLELEEIDIDIDKENPVDEEDSKIQDYDDMLKYKVGQFGLAQALVVFLICIPAAIPGPMAFFSQVFLSATPNHWCYTPQLANSNLTLDQIKTLTLPRHPEDSSKFSQCQVYDTDFINYLNTSNWLINPNPKWNTTKCTHGWTYDKSMFESTIVTDFDLVCDKDLFPTIANAVANLGMVIGGIIFAWISDKYGRKKGLILAVALLLVSGTASSFSTEIYSWMTLRMIFVSSMSLYFTVYVYAIEFVGRRYRGAVSVVLALCYSFSMMILCFCAYFIRSWKNLSLVISVPSIIILAALWFIPESPRWLYTTGKFDELKIVLTKIAKINGKKEFNYDLTKLKDPEAEITKNSNGSVLDLFRTPNMRKKMIILTYLNFITGICYFGLSLFASEMVPNMILGIFLAGVVEIPGNIIGFLLMDKWGRRWTTTFTYLVAGVAAIVALELRSINHILMMALFLFAKMSIAGNYMPIVPFTSELLPTNYRNLGLALTTSIGTAGTAIIPFILYLGQSYLRLPLVIIGALTITAGFLCAFLPETLHQSMPETLQDAEEFGKNMTLKDYLRCIPLKRKETVDSTDF
ncbi:Carcinine transporter [Nymphon striatum]|nr:Carcinine transporter [Nymphon striatum]